MDIDGELEFQDFSKAAPNASSTSPQAPAYSNLPLNGQLSPQSNQSANSPQQQQQQQQPGSGGKFWHLEYYSQYFNVDTAMVSQRLAVALIPVKKYLDVANGNPDLYGPIWITATVVFAIFFGDTIATSAQRGKASYDFGKLTAAASVFYSIVGLIPLIIWGVSRYFHIKARFIELVALFGYGLTVWIPVSVSIHSNTVSSVSSYRAVDFCGDSLDLCTMDCVLGRAGRICYVLCSQLYTAVLLGRTGP